MNYSYEQKCNTIKEMLTHWCNSLPLVVYTYPKSVVLVRPPEFL